MISTGKTRKPPMKRRSPHPTGRTSAIPFEHVLDSLEPVTLGELLPFPCPDTAR